MVPRAQAALTDANLSQWDARRGEPVRRILWRAASGGQEPSAHLGTV